jgi:hypothetical protein
MAAVKCVKCGAVVRLTLVTGQPTVNHGASFLTKCRELGGSNSDLSLLPIECASMQTAITRTAARLSAAAAPIHRFTALP